MRVAGQHADRVRAPVLLITATDDTSYRLPKAARWSAAYQRGKSVQLVELEGEDHWLSRPKTRLETLQALDAFLAEHLAK